MAKNTLYDFDATFGNNTEVAGQSTAGTAAANTIDTIFQKLMAVMAVFADEIGGIGTVAGTADAITLTTSSTYPIQSLASGVVVSFKAGAANTGAATINVDAQGAKAIRRQGDTALSANDIVANGVYLLRYDTAYNSAAGAWVLLNPTVSSSISAASTVDLLTGSDASKYATADAIAALWEKGSNIASASTLTIGEGGYFHVTGTTTITDIDFSTAKDGRCALLVFDGVLTLTHNATTLILPGGANITTAAGDSCLVYQDNSDNVKVALYQRASGSPLVTGTITSMTLLGTLNAASASTVSLTGIAAGYRQLYIEFDNISSSSNTWALQIALSSTNGSSYGTAGSITGSVTSGATVLNGFALVGNISSTIAAAKSAVGFFNSNNTGVSDGTPTDTAAVANAIRLSLTAGNFDGSSGAIRVYGVK